MEQRSLEKSILKLEQQLLKKEVRHSAEQIAELLSDDFTENCSSGKLYHYSKGDVFDQNIDPSEPEWEIVDFSIKLLSENVILAIYRVVKCKGKQELKSSLRSSIWKRFDDKWKLVFHQGTIVPATIK